MSIFQYLVASLILFAFLNGAQGLPLGTDSLKKRASPKIDPKASFTKLQTAQIEQGVKDACALANAAYDFSRVRVTLNVESGSC